MQFSIKLKFLYFFGIIFSLVLSVGVVYGTYVIADIYLDFDIGTKVVDQVENEDSMKYEKHQESAEENIPTPLPIVEDIPKLAPLPKEKYTLVETFTGSKEVDSFGDIFIQLFEYENPAGTSYYYTPEYLINWTVKAEIDTIEVNVLLSNNEYIIYLNGGSASTYGNCDTRRISSCEIDDQAALLITNEGYTNTLVEYEVKLYKINY